MLQAYLKAARDAELTELAASSSSTTGNDANRQPRTGDHARVASDSESRYVVRMRYRGPSP